MNCIVANLSNFDFLSKIWQITCKLQLYFLKIAHSTNINPERVQNSSFVFWPVGCAKSVRTAIPCRAPSANSRPRSIVLYGSRKPLSSELLSCLTDRVARAHREMHEYLENFWHYKIRSLHCNIFCICLFKNCDFCFKILRSIFAKYSIFNLSDLWQAAKLQWLTSKF